MSTGQLKFVTYEAYGLGDRSYLVHDDSSAVVVDAQRDPAPYLATAAELGLAIEAVLETHVHNDYLSGGLALARRTGAIYGIPADEPVGYARQCRALAEGDEVAVGSFTVRALATPGHTPHHLSYLAEATAGDSLVLTGGALLAGTTGRTDLFGPARAKPLAEAQWSSVRRLLDELAPGTVVLPTHGFGSFCAAGPSAVGTEEVTIGVERSRNPVAHLARAAFVRALLGTKLPVPTYYQFMGAINRAGVAEMPERPVPEVDAGSLAGLRRDGTAIVDLRPRRHFAGQHWRGALNMELGPSLATYLGWALPYGHPVVLLGDAASDVGQARRLLAAIGLDDLAGWALSSAAAELGPEALGCYPVAGYHDLAQRARHGGLPTVLDVRFPYEWAEGHIVGARNLPLPELGPAVEGLAGEDEVWVHCGGGFRAAVAASWLAGSGLRPVLVDDVFGNAAAAGLPVVDGQGQAA